MKNKFCKVLIACAVLLLVSQVINAEIRTTPRASENEVYVAGNPDFYPIEYYNSETKQFEGVMPEILKTVASRTGLNIKYIYDPEFTSTELAENLQVEVVSAYVTDSSEDFAVDSVTVFSYEAEGKTINIGLAFTKIADETLVEILKNETAGITENEINGYFMACSDSAEDDKNLFEIIAVLCCVFLTIIILLLCLKLRRTTRQLSIDKMTDPATGIGNIAYFENQFNTKISDSSRTLYYIAHIMIDSNFLQLYHGESVFIDAVKYAASVLWITSNHNGFVARITENSFALAFQSPNESEAKEHIEAMIGKLNMSTDNSQNGKLKPIFHASVYNLHKDDYNCELILFNLRKNCSKIIGTDTQIVFCDVHAMNSAIEEKKLIESFSDGFKNKEFKLYIQFIVDNKTKKITSAEALSRWESPDKGLLIPTKYIESMESVGMISELDFYMFEMVCRQLHKWRDTEFGDVSVSCNFTRITLSENDFIERLKEIASKYVFDKSKLVIEITEDAIEKNIKNALDNVFECKKMGFTIALDDLGSGYTSLINLCDYPIDIVKIDRDILLKTEMNSGKDLFEGMVALAHSLNKKVVCEGVETEEQNEFVSTSDCDYIQGWYYSGVLPVKESENYYRQYCNEK